MGMFIHKMEGSWWNHPFWKAKFLLSDEDQLSKLRNAAIEAVIIDTEKGLDVPALGSGEAADEMPAILQPGTRSRARKAAALEVEPDEPSGPRSTRAEFGKALQVSRRGIKVVSRVFLEARLGKAIKAATLEPVIEDIFASVKRNPHAFNGLMRCKQNVEYVYRHALSVSALMISLARQLGLGDDEIKMAGMAGLLLDTGIGLLPVDLAPYGGDYRKLAPELLRDHVWIGHDFLNSAGIAHDVAQAALEHHERIDGTGYPQKLTGDAISQLGRMAAICDMYDHLANDIDGMAGLGPARTLARMEGMSGAFDPDLLAAFVQAMGVYPIGAVVLLRSGRLALVVDQHSVEASQPRVRCFWSHAAGAPARHEDIDLSDGSDAIERAIDPANCGIADFAALREQLFTGACAA